jgi:hypothetical protein
MRPIARIYCIPPMPSSNATAHIFYPINVRLLTITKFSDYEDHLRMGLRQCFMNYAKLVGTSLEIRY